MPTCKRACKRGLLPVVPWQQAGTQRLTAALGEMKQLRFIAEVVPTLYLDVVHCK